MEIIHSRLMSAIVLVIIVALYAISLLSLDYTFVGDGFSPFKVWNPRQTAYLAIAGFILLSILILDDVRGRNTNLRRLLHVPPILGISFLILFSMDSRQLLHYLPSLQVFLFDDFGSLFLFGGLLGVYLTYLVSANFPESISTQNGLVEFGFRLVLVVFFGSILLGTLFFFGISFCLALGLQVIPFYGEGTIGSILVVSVLLGMYTVARILSYVETNDFPSLRSIGLGQVFRATLELAVVYLCTTAGFSLIGGLVTDGVPAPELIPLNVVILGFYALMPFSVLLTRSRAVSMPRPC